MELRFLAKENPPAYPLRMDQNKINGILASASRTATVTSKTINNDSGRGIKVILDVTNNDAAGNITVTINFIDPLSGKAILLLAGAAVSTVSTNVYTVYPGLPATANVSANDIAPPLLQIVVTHNNANAITYSVSAAILL